MGVVASQAHSLLPIHAGDVGVGLDQGEDDTVPLDQ